MDVLINRIDFVKAENTGGLIFSDEVGRVVRHDIDTVIQMEGITIKGVFRFRADRFGENTSIEDYKNAIKNLFRERK